MTDFVSKNTHVHARVFRYNRNPLDLVAEIEGPTLKGFGTIVAASMQKQMAGAGAGSWSITMKSQNGRVTAVVMNVCG